MIIDPDHIRNISDEDLREYASRIEAVASLASDAGHEFNNILQAIRGYIELALVKSSKNSKNYEYLKEIYNATIRGNDLTKRLLVLGKPFELNTEKREYIENLNKEISGIKKIIERNIPKRINTKYTLRKDLYHLYIDPQHIEQIILSLVINSVESIKDTGTITIETGNTYLDYDFLPIKNHFSEGNHVYIKITDTGCGIHNSIIKHIFDPFFSTKNKDRDTVLISPGLGLSVVNNIVKNYKGAIDVDSNKDETSFTVYFPADTDHSDEKHEYISDIEELKAGNNETVLVLDDNSSVINVCSDILKAFGYQVLECHDTRTALDLIKDEKTKIDLIITDNKNNFLRKVKNINNSNKVIVMSGLLLSHKQRQKLFDLGANDFIEKPFKTETLLQSVRKVLDN